MQLRHRSLRFAIGTAFVGVLAFAATTHAQPVVQVQGSAHWVIPADVFGVVVGNRTMSVTATKFSDGRVQGAFEYHQVVEGVAYIFTGRVTCVSIYDGNRAKFGGVITNSNDPTVPAGTFGWFQVLDRGEGGNASPDQSTIMGIGDEAANEAFCASSALPRFIFDVQGSIQVR